MNLKKWISIGVAALLVLILLCTTIVSTPIGSIRIGTTMGAPNGIVYNPGTTFKAPFVMGTIQMTLREQMYEFTGTARTSDGIHVDSFVARVYFYLDPNMATNVFEKYTANWEEYLIKNAAPGMMKSAFPKFTAQEVYANREQIPAKCTELFNIDLKETGVTVGRVELVDYNFDASFTDAMAKRVLLNEQEEAAIINQRIQTKNNEIADQKADTDNGIKRKNADAQAYENEQLAKTFTDENARKLFLEKWDGKLVPAINGTQSVIIPKELQGLIPQN